jgi:elongation factor P hydroxylase
MMALNDLIQLLNTQYLNNYNTKLIGGFDEPFYQSFINDKAAEIQFTQDYIRSALHELAHWCVAGVERRKQDDYGYWYAADGRDQQQQYEFFKVEVKPQTIEWAFSVMCGVGFEPSIDNLTMEVDGQDKFRRDLYQCMQFMLSNSFSKRTSEIINILARHCAISEPYELLSQICRKKLVELK